MVVRAAAVPGLDRARLARRPRSRCGPSCGERLTARGNPARARPASATRSMDLGGNANRARSWAQGRAALAAGRAARPARRLPADRRPDAAAVGRRATACTRWRSPRRRSTCCPTPSCACSPRHRLPDGLRRPRRRSARARGVLRVSAATVCRRCTSWSVRTTCSVGRAMEILGERWTFLILRESFYGVRRFSDMQRNLGIARNILSTRLQTLVARGHPRAPPLPGGARALRVPADARPAATCIPRSSRSCAGATSTSPSEPAPPVVLRHSCGDAGRPGARLRALPRARCTRTTSRPEPGPGAPRAALRPHALGRPASPSRTLGTRRPQR